MNWKTIKTEVIVNDYHATVKKNTVQLPDGAVIEDFYTITIPDAAMVAAITEDGNILLKSEYRYACQETVIECPAGMIELGEEPFAAAKRELLEETGYTSTDWTYLGYTWESTSKLTNKMHLFVARTATPTTTQHLDPNEHLEVMKVSLKDAVDLVMDGKINANSTAHLILKVARDIGI